MGIPFSLNTNAAIDLKIDIGSLCHNFLTIELLSIVCLSFVKVSEVLSQTFQYEWAVTANRICFLFALSSIGFIFS